MLELAKTNPTISGVGLVAVLVLTVFGIYLRFGKSTKQVMLLDTLEVLLCDHVINVANYRTLLPLQLLHRPRKRMHHRPMMKKVTNLLVTKMQARETKIRLQQQQRQRLRAIRQTAPSLPVPRRTKSLI